MNLLEKINEASNYIKNHAALKPTIGLILGSGLGELADKIENPIKIKYSSIPHFPVSTVEGHAGQLVIGNLEGKKVVAMQGRFHYYEGYSMEQVTFPVRVMKALGVKNLIVTNACGGLNPDFHAGLLMFITDHINFTGDNPLIGYNHNELGPRFPDMSAAYDKNLIKLGKEIANNNNIETVEGIYTAVSGPNYVSKAELRLIRNWGSDTIGMSTVPEVIVANHMGLKILGISCITDMAIPDSLESVSHEQVMEMANKVKPDFITLVKGIVELID